EQGAVGADAPIGVADEDRLDRRAHVAAELADLRVEAAVVDRRRDAGADRQGRAETEAAADHDAHSASKMWMPSLRKTIRFALSAGESETAGRRMVTGTWAPPIG